MDPSVGHHVIKRKLKIESRRNENIEVDEWGVQRGWIELGMNT